MGLLLACTSSRPAAQPTAAELCAEHGVAVSVCDECDPELSADDSTPEWCEEHAMPEADCGSCKLASLSAANQCSDQAPVCGQAK